MRDERGKIYPKSGETKLLSEKKDLVKSKYTAIDNVNIQRWFNKIKLKKWFIINRITQNSKTKWE